MRRSVILYTTLALSLSSWGMVAAQNPAGSPPPTYGQNILSDYDARLVRPGQLIVPLVVSSDSLLTVLPAGYTVPGDTATINLNFSLQQRDELPRAIGTLAAGTYGPASSFIVGAPDVINPEGHYEQVLIDNERSTDDNVSLEPPRVCRRAVGVS